jgi:hypothetical protein
MFDKSLDGGLTFGSDIFVTDQPGGWAFDIPGISRCNGFPVTGCDVGNSPYQGTIYIVWSDQRNGLNNTDIFLTKSTNDGADWSSPVRVNDDSTSRHQFFPWMAIDQSTGYIYIVFYDRRNTMGNITEVYVARSTDGGERFTNFPVSESAFLPVDYVFFGDYTNIAARDGMIYPMWMRMDQGILSVWVAIVEDSILTDIQDYPDVTAANFHLSQNYPNPFNPNTMINFQLAITSQVSLTVHDILGREISTLIDRQMPAGNYRVIWDATDKPAGIYYYTIRAGDYREVKKMILVK